MKRHAWLLVFLLLIPAAVSADTTLLSFTGFDYQDPNPSGTYLDLGEGWKSVGDITSVPFPPLVPYFDASVNEYTYYMKDLTVIARFFAFPNLTVQFANNGRVDYWEDPIVGGLSARDYGINPPNATAPSTFTDGTLKLTGDIDNFVLTFNFTTNQGSFGGNVTLDGGTALIYVPSGQRSGWILGGLKNKPGAPPAPTGYDHQVEGSCYVPETATETKTWGTLKKLYR